MVVRDLYSSSTLMRHEVDETVVWDISLYSEHLVSQLQDLRKDYHDFKKSRLDVVESMLTTPKQL